MCQRAEWADVYGNLRGRDRPSLDEQVGRSAQGDGFRRPGCLFRFPVPAFAQGRPQAGNGDAATATRGKSLNNRKAWSDGVMECCVLIGALRPLLRTEPVGCRISTWRR
jgi:hypothetical protein